MMRQELATWISLLGLLIGLPAQNAQQPDPELPGVRQAGDRIASALGLSGAGLAVVLADRELHRSMHGNFRADTVLPIASASKWLTVATILTLVDDGTLDLSHPVARYVEEFDRDDKRRVTLTQCLSCTSGLPARLGSRMRGWDMQQFAEQAARAGLREQPNAAFLYGGVGFQVVALAAERATGKTWHALFQERIAGPLGMKHTAFGTLLPVGAEPGTASLPWVAGGAVSTLADYERFVQMLVAGGEWQGERILSVDSVDRMLRDQVPPLVEVHPVGFEAKDVRYGLGTWIETLNDDVVRVSDPGAFGFTPWIDRDLGVGGVFAVEDRVRRVMSHLGRLQQTVRESLQTPEVAGSVTTVALRHDGRSRRYHLHVPPHHQQTPGLPLLLVLHGGGGNGEQVRESTRLDEVGVQNGFVVAFPDGTGRLPRRLLTWNSGGIDVYAAQEKVDDVGFLKQVVADIQHQVAIDTDRVFVVGHSNGGMMCHRLAREAADVFAGIAVVEGAMNFTDVDERSSIAVMLVHGTADKHVLIHGGQTEVGRGKQAGRVDASLQQAIDYYVARNDLSGYPDTKVDGDVRIDTYTVAKGLGEPVPVRVVTLDGGGHAWPGGTPGSLLADNPFPWPASRAIVEFFAGLQPTPRSTGSASKAKNMPPSVPR